jgi:opacity family porin
MSARRRVLVGVFVISRLFVPSRAVAEHLQNAIGTEIGVFVPPHEVVTSNRFGEITLTKGAMWQALFDRGISEHGSVRFDVGWAQTHAGQERNTGIRDIWLSGDVLQHAGNRRVRPFFGAGVGLYFVRRQEFTVDLPARKKVGANVLGGVEYFTSRTLSIKGEVRYHIVTRLRDWTTYDDPTGLSLSIGVKHHF